jgi:hypothetical protein
MVGKRVWTAGSPMFSVLVKQESVEQTQDHIYIYEFNFRLIDDSGRYAEYGTGIYDYKKRLITCRYANNFTGNKHLYQHRNGPM